MKKRGIVSLIIAIVCICCQIGSISAYAEDGLRVPVQLCPSCNDVNLRLVRVYSTLEDENIGVYYVYVWHSAMSHYDVYTAWNEHEDYRCFTCGYTETVQVQRRQFLSCGDPGKLRTLLCAVWDALSRTV